MVGATTCGTAMADTLAVCVITNGTTAASDTSGYDEIIMNVVNSDNVVTDYHKWTDIGANTFNDKKRQKYHKYNTNYQISKTGWNICNDNTSCTYTINTNIGGYNNDYIIKHDTYATTGNWSWEECEPFKQLTPQERLREIIRSRHAPAFHSRRNPMRQPEDIRETRARETLRAVLGEDKFRQFIKNGFVTVWAKSGLVYQIFTGHGITRVYDKGKQVERLCVVLRGNFPPTDELIMRYLLILNDERDFRKHAIKHTVSRPEKVKPVMSDKSLTEIYREITSKQAA